MSPPLLERSLIGVVLAFVLFCGFLCPLEGSISIHRKSKIDSFSTFTWEDVNENSPSVDSSLNHRFKRDVDVEANPTNSSKIVSTPNILNDTHTQLLVYWAGKDVIICLARDVKGKENSTSTLYISEDYGGTFVPISDKLKVDGKLPLLEKFFNHPNHNGMFVFTDVINKHIFVAHDYGKSFEKYKVEFVPDQIQFDPHSNEILIGLETTTSEKQMWVTKNAGKEWTMVESRVQTVEWDETFVPPKLVIQRLEPDGKSVLRSSKNLFLSPTETVVELNDVEEFEVQNDYKFATRKIDDEGNLELLIAHQRHGFIPAMFPKNYPAKHFHIADVSPEGQIFVCVVHNETLCNLYIGNVPEDGFSPPTFSLSLERVVFFKPNYTWTESWLNDVTDETLVDLHAVEGIRGVYIASQISTSVIGAKKFSMEHVTSVVTYDQGGQWQVLTPPEFDDDGRPIYCQHIASSGRNCSLHVSQELSRVYPKTRAVPILSKKSAVGLVLATGTVNTTLKGEISVFLSNDGAISWRQILQGNYLYGFGDHGGILVATKYYKIGDATNELIYSLDEGESWNKYKFHEEKVKVLGLMTEQGENSTVFFIFGSVSEKHSWVLIKVDFRDIFDRNCTKDDYKLWSFYDLKPEKHCLLGSKVTYERRISNRICYNGRDYERKINQTSCLCERKDFECDFGYKLDLRSFSSTEKCIEDAASGVKPQWCKPGLQFYNRTKGYRKIPGDSCSGGDEDLYNPDVVPCPMRNASEFMLVAKRDSIRRIDLNDFNVHETLPLGLVRSVIAVDYDLHSNCLFWSDVHEDKIMKLHLDGHSVPETIVSSQIKSVEGIAYDWITKNLYFSDGTERKIEVIRTNIDHGRSRKVILNDTILEKPRGITIHPMKGYIFWTDWSASNPSIGRSWLDGTHAKSIVTKAQTSNIVWPNGITIDFNMDKIYWVDANKDLIMESDFEGSNLKVLLSDSPASHHPFGIAVYKQTLYWDDWVTNSVYFGDLKANDFGNSVELLAANISRLMDVKVYGRDSQTGSNDCDPQVNKCPANHMCFFTPNAEEKVSCVCPNGLIKHGNECLCPDGKAVTDSGRCESNCNSTDVFHCSSTDFCISNAWVCDNSNDCGDNEDEKHCDAEVYCTDNKFMCKSDGKCLPISFRCDWDEDCSDGSDEEGCEEIYPPCDADDKFKCSNGRCIMKKWLCDGDDDCKDGSDELNCPNIHHLPDGECQPGEYKCENQTEFQCISADWICDLDSDCVGKSDEANCTEKTCPSYKFRCGGGECILFSWKCDGDTDCTDGSDEQNCTNIPPTLPPPLHPFPKGNCSAMSQMYECASGTCIPIFWRCDKTADCDDGSDEIGCPDEDPSGENPPTEVVTLGPDINRCAIDQWMCHTGECIAISSRCDGFPDCANKEDEMNCHNYTRNDCPAHQSQCGMLKICVDKARFCDDVSDCPNNFDEMWCHLNQTTAPHCNSGQFSCDEGICKALHFRCNGRDDCVDGSDESPVICNDSYERIYQIEGVDVKSKTQSSVVVEWHADPSLKKPMEFLPSICEVESQKCFNATWSSESRDFEFGGEQFPLHAFTKYSVTVYVRIIGKEKVYPPAVYETFMTAEGKPSAPHNLNITQPEKDKLCAYWKAPVKPNGIIRTYILYFQRQSEQPEIPMSIHTKDTYKCLSDKRSTSIFDIGVNYTFWVSATNSFAESERSESVIHEYNGDIASVTNLRYKSTTTDSVKLAWSTTTNKFDLFEVTTRLGSKLYPFANKFNTTNSDETVRSLAPGTEYQFSVRPIYRNTYGMEQHIIVSTKGEKLPTVRGFKVSNSKSSPNTVTLTWDAVQSTNKIKLSGYAIYYGRDINEIVEAKVRNSTQKTSIDITNLEACEEYMFDVGVVVNENIMGPLTGKPKQFTTSVDETSPPKNVQVFPVPEERTKVRITWNSPCHYQMSEPLSYNLTLHETKQNKMYGLDLVQKSRNVSLEYVARVRYGGNYELTVSSSHPKGRPSKVVKFEGPPIPFPEVIDQCTTCDPPTVFWERPKIPHLVEEHGNVTYVVRLSDDIEMINPKVYETKERSISLPDIEVQKIYYVTVSVKDAQGLESPPSPMFVVQQMVSSGLIKIPTSNALAYVLTTLSVIIVLVCIIGFIYVRHKRLQISFFNFASSHYNSNSGAATFQQNMDEQDAPVIRGFSDDEPLLIA